MIQIQYFDQHVIVIKNFKILQGQLPNFYVNVISAYNGFDV